MQGLSAMKVHKSRLERERDEAEKRRADTSGQEKPLPSYMRATKAFIMKKVSSFCPSSWHFWLHSQPTI